MKLDEPRNSYPDVLILTLTTTTTPLVRQDAINILQLRDPKLYETKFRLCRFLNFCNRPNIRYSILEKSRAVNVTEIAKIKFLQ